MKHNIRKRILKQTISALARMAIAGLLAGCSSIRADRNKAAFKPVKFLSVNDMHLSDENSAAYPKKVIQAMNNEGGDLVLVCGDLGTSGKRSELEVAKNVLDGLKMPYYPIVGNHDAARRGDNQETVFKEIFGLASTNYHFVKKGVSFIGIDHGCGSNYGKNQVCPETMAWIKDTLTTIPAARPIVLFSHYPFAKGVKYQTKNANAVIALFKGHNLRAIVSGHFHGNTETIENGILMTTSACASGTRGNHDGTKAKGYRVFTLDADGRISTEFKEVTP